MNMDEWKRLVEGYNPDSTNFSNYSSDNQVGSYGSNSTTPMTPMTSSGNLGSQYSNLSQTNKDANYDSQNSILENWKAINSPKLKESPKYMFGENTPDFMKNWTADGMGTVGTLAGGAGNLMAGIAAWKNLGLTKDMMNMKQDNYLKDRSALLTTTNNQINNVNAWKKAQGRTDYEKNVS